MSTECVAGDAYGAEVTFDPADATNAPTGVVNTQIDITYWPLVGLACPSATQCTAVDDNFRTALTFDPTPPAGTSSVEADTQAGANLLAVACPSATSCVAVDSKGDLILGTPAASGGGAGGGSVGSGGATGNTGTTGTTGTGGVSGPPNTVLKGSKLTPKRHQARFTFTAQGNSTGFQCAIVRVPAHGHAAKPHYKACHSPQSYGHLVAGIYIFYVRATGPGGTDPTPISHRFKIA
jgi:hypothetical protein